MANKGIYIRIYTKIVDIHIAKGKPRAANFAVSTDVRCKSPEQGILVLLIFAVVHDLYGSYNG